MKTIVHFAFLGLLIPVIGLAMSHKAKPDNVAKQQSSSNSAKVEVLPQEAYIDLMPTTDINKIRTIRITLTLHYTGAGTIEEVPMQFFYDEKRIDSVTITQTPKKEDIILHELKVKETLDISQVIIIPEAQEKKIDVKWIDPQTRELRTKNIEIHRVY